MNNLIKRIWKQNNMTSIEDLQGSAFTAESGGHTFQISGVDANGDALSLSGTVVASFIRSDVTTVALSGSASGGVVSVTLTAECYGVPGRFGLVIFLTSDSQKTAIYSCVGNVARSSTGNVSPGTTANVVDLINQINAAVATIPASYSALMADIAPTYSDSALYAVGNYAWYNGDLKRCISPITTAESYTAAHWTSAVLGQDVSDLKSALYNIVPENLTGYTFGSYIQCASSVSVGDTVNLTPVETANMKYMIVDVEPEDVFTATGRAQTGYKGWFQVDSSNKYVQGGGVIYDDEKITITTAGKIVFNANYLNDYYVKKGEDRVEDLETEDIEIKSRISYDEGTVNILTGNKRIDFTDGAYITTSNFTPPIPNTSANSNYAYALDSCSPGDVYNIKGKFGYNTTIRGWIFFNSSGTRIDNGEYNVQYNDWKQIVVPANAAYIAFNVNKTVDYIVIKNKLLLDKVDGKPSYMTGLSWENGYITANGSESSGTNYKRTSAFQVKAGQTLYITAEMRVSTGSLLSRWKQDGTFIESLISGKVEAGVTKTWTADVDSYVRISMYSTGAETFQISDPTPIETGKAISNLNIKTDSLMYEWERVLNAVCCIGDSLTKGAYYVNGHDGEAIAQNYPYFFGKQTGLTVQNEGFSGSSPSSRWTYFSTYDFTPYNAFFIWWGTNGGLTDTLYTDGVIDGEGELISDYTQYADTNTGDYCKVIGKIISQVPHAKIFLATVYTTSGDVETTNTVINKIAELYPNNVMGIVDCDDGTLYAQASKHLTPSWVHIDNITHFSMVGNYYLAVHWIKAVRSIIAANPATFENIMEDIISD